MVLDQIYLPTGHISKIYGQNFSYHKWSKQVYSPKLWNQHIKNLAQLQKKIRSGELSEVTKKSEKVTTPEARCGSLEGTPHIYLSSLEICDVNHDIIVAYSRVASLATGCVVTICCWSRKFDSDKSKMFNTELQSFVIKFHQLQNAGFTAHLDLHAPHGECWVGLRAQLGQDQRNEYQWQF